MICPHCEYENGGKMDCDKNEWVEIEGNKGSFWVSKLDMERNEGSDCYSNGYEKTKLYACPSCGKTFIEVN